MKQDHQGALSQMKESNERAMIEMSEQYKAKLIVEYQKYSGLEEMYTSIKKSYDKKMSAVEKATKVLICSLLLFTLNLITTVTLTKNNLITSREIWDFVNLLTQTKRKYNSDHLHGFRRMYVEGKRRKKYLFVPRISLLE